MTEVLGSSNLGNSLAELSKAAQLLRFNLDTYGRGPGFAASEDQVVEEPSSSGGPVPVGSSSSAFFKNEQVDSSLLRTKESGSSAMNVDPDRLQFTHSQTFHPEPFISDPLLKAGFMDPRHLRIPQTQWPKVRHARVMCSRDNLFRLYRKWGSVNCLKLLDSSSSEAKYRRGLFVVYKNLEKDRQILNPIPENSRTLALNDSTVTLAHGSLLCHLFLEDSEDLVMGADDLEDFYHCFKVPDAHAHRNRIHGLFPAERFEGFNAWHPGLRGKMVVGCFSTLAMGTSYAVEVAQHVHSNLLSRAGVLGPNMQVCYRKPLPRSPVLLLLCIDDLAVLQKVPCGVSSSCTSCAHEDRRLLDRAGQAYNKVGLRTSRKKAVRDSFQNVVLGGELDGKRGALNAPRLRILVLAKLTLQLVHIGWSSKRLLETIIGCWIFVVLFRRPLLALPNDVFHEGDSQKDRHACFPLSTGCKQELN